jgi:hypothetical protein
MFKKIKEFFFGKPTSVNELGLIAPYKVEAQEVVIESVVEELVIVETPVEVKKPVNAPRKPRALKDVPSVKEIPAKLANVGVMKASTTSKLKKG